MNSESTPKCAMNCGIVWKVYRKCQHLCRASECCWSAKSSSWDAGDLAEEIAGAALTQEINPDKWGICTDSDRSNRAS